MGKGDRRPSMKMKRRVRQQKFKNKQTRLREEKHRQRMEAQKEIERVKPEPESPRNNSKPDSHLSTDVSTEAEHYMKRFDMLDKKTLNAEPKEQEPETDIRAGIPDRKTLDANALLDNIVDLNLDMVEYMLEIAKVDPNHSNDRGMPPIIAAAKTPQTRVLFLELLLDHGADINTQDNANGHTPLMIAVLCYAAGSVELLLGRGADKTIKDYRGATAEDHCRGTGPSENASKILKILHSKSKVMTSQDINKKLRELEVEEKKEEELKVKMAYSGILVREILEGNYRQVKHLMGVDYYDPDVPDKLGNLPIMVARKQGVEFLKLLLDRGVNINAQDTNGNTALLDAVKEKDIESVKFLLERGADTGVVDNSQKTIYDYDSFGYFKSIGEPVPEDAKKLHELLGKYKVGSHSKADELISSILKNDASKVKHLLETENINPDYPDCDGRRALIEAVEQDNIEIVKLLFDNKASPHVVDRFENSPLHYAVEKNNLEIAQLLLEHSAYADMQGTEMQTPLHLAVKEFDFPMVELLLKYEAHPNMEDDDLRTTLHIAMDEFEFDNDLNRMLKLLLEHGADPNMKSFQKQVVLCDAAEAGALEAVKLVIEHGADTNIQDKEGKTPLIRAIEEVHMDVIEFLLEKGANPEWGDYEGRDASFYAGNLIEDNETVEKIEGMIKERINARQTRK